jgi:N6-adenosine-specific RNA methylase IME4
MHGVVDQGLLRTTNISDLFGIDADVILIDAPFRFRTYSQRGEGRCPQIHYHCPIPDELADLPLAKIAGRDCFLFSWVPNPHAPLAEPLMRAWGFKFSGSGLVWVKTNRTKPGFWMGGGLAGTRKNVEIAWLGRRGSPERANKGVSELIIGSRREHSRKPDEQYVRIERLVGSGKTLVELFARQCWSKWHCWGDQLDQFTPNPELSFAEWRHV